MIIKLGMHLLQTLSIPMNFNDRAYTLLICDAFFMQTALFHGALLFFSLFNLPL